MKFHFIRDVIHGDAESRAHWFTYAIGSIFGFKGLDKAGKVSVQAAKQGAQKTGQKLDELLPYHPKHQLAIDGPVPYNVYDGVNLRDQLMVKVENVSGKGIKSGDKNPGKDIDNAKDITKLTVDDIPTAKSGNFNNFFKSLTSNELDELWKDKKIRKKIERQLRAPGGLHEWHLVSRAPQFKYWNIGAEEIKELRTAISDVKFVNPNGVHGGLGSTKAHNELLAIIDTSTDYNTFVRRLNNWASYRLEGGILSLPQGLRLK